MLHLGRFFIMYRILNVMKKVTLLVAVILIVNAPAGAQTAADALKVDDFSFQMVATSRGISPEAVVRLDNNFQILTACIEGKTMEELANEKIPFTQSQLQLMVFWNLLEQVGEKLHTTFPIITPDRTAYIRNTMKSYAATIGKSLDSDIKALTAVLKSQGFENSAYSIIFTYVLGDLTWQKFAEKNIVIKGPITPERPYWNGKMWAITPPRLRQGMSTSLEGDSYSLKFHWNPVLSGKVSVFMSNIELVGQMLNDIEKQGFVQDERVLQMLGPFNIIDSGGKLTVPVIDEAGDNQLARQCSDFALKIRDSFLENVDFSNLTSEAKLLNEFNAFAVAFQEFVREFLPWMVQAGLITEPQILADPNADLSGMHDLVFMTKNKVNRE